MDSLEPTANHTAGDLVAYFPDGKGTPIRFIGVETESGLPLEPLPSDLAPLPDVHALGEPACAWNLIVPGCHEDQLVVHLEVDGKPVATIAVRVPDAFHPEGSWYHVPLLRDAWGYWNCRGNPLPGEFREGP